MKYAHSIEQSAAYLKRALPLMSRQDAGLHPVSYAIWYEYVAGTNPPLSASIDGRTRNGAVLDEQATLELFQKHIAEIDEDISRRVSEGLQKALAGLARSASQAGDDVGEYGRVLARWAADLAHNGGLGSAVDLLIRHTQAMQGSMAALQASLDDSRREIEQLRHEVSTARRDARLDPLTGLGNRRGFDAALASCLAAAVEPGPCLIMLDVDFFKRINDTYGHVFGDRVLLGIARILKDNVKGKDLAARYGGEEFVVLLPETPLDGASRLAEKLRAEIEKCRIRRLHGDLSVGNITASLGLAAHRHGEAAQDFVGRTDHALYISKRCGRNRVTVAGTPAEP